MEITIKKQVEETVSIKVPSFYKEPGVCPYIVALFEDGIGMKIYDSGTDYVNIQLFNPQNTNTSDIQKWITWPPISQGEFNHHYNEAIKKQSKYISAHVMPVELTHGTIEFEI